MGFDKIDTTRRPLATLETEKNKEKELKNNKIEVDEKLKDKKEKEKKEEEGSKKYRKIAGGRIKTK